MEVEVWLIEVGIKQRLECSPKRVAGETFGVKTKEKEGGRWSRGWLRVDPYSNYMARREDRRWSMGWLNCSCWREGGM